MVRLIKGFVESRDNIACRGHLFSVYEGRLGGWDYYRFTVVSYASLATLNIKNSILT